MNSRTAVAPDVATNEPPSFGAALRLRRRALDLTQEELAGRAGCARSTIKRIEADDLRPSKQLAGALAEHLGLPPEARDGFVRFARGGAGTAQLPPLALAPLHVFSLASSPSHLPHPVSILIGREHEIETLRQMLSEDWRSARLLTLTGPGGVGKTSLAVKVATSLSDHFSHGIFFVDLAPLTEATLIAPTIAHALGMRTPDSRPSQVLLQEYLRDRQILLLLDNFEHVISGAPLISDLLAACPRLQVLVTSRERLRLRGERLIHVPPLTLPDPERLAAIEPAAQSAAVELFVRRARDLRPDFALTDENVVDVAEICRQLDGLPLAIELAAAGLNVLSPRDVRLRLERRLPVLNGGRRDSPARHQSLHAVLAWSYERLADDEKALFRQASIFVGSWSLEAAEAVCRVSSEVGTQPPALLLDLLLRLVEKSLIATEECSGTTRYRMLQTVSEYASSLVAEPGGIERLQARYLDYFMRLAEAGEAGLDGVAQSAWLDRLAVEQNNLRAAMRFAAERGDHERGLRFAGALARFWEIRGYFAEGRQHLTLALASAPRGEPGLAPLRARALLGAATLARLQTDFATARSAVEESLGISRALGDAYGNASGLLELGTLEWFRGDYPNALLELERARADYSVLGNQVGLGKTLTALGRVHERQGDYHAARALLEESLALARQRNDQRAIAITLGHLGAVCWYLRENPSARSKLEESLVLSRDLRDKEVTVEASLYLANVCRSQGDYARARELHQDALRLAEAIGNKQRIGYALFNLGLDAHHLGDNLAARVLAEQSLQLFRELGDRRGMARASEALGMALVADGRLAAGCTQHEKCLRLSRELGDKGSIGYSLIHLAQVAYHQADFERVLLLLAESMQQFQGRENKGLSLAALVLLTGVLQGGGQLKRSARLAGKAALLLDETTTVLEPMEQALYERTKLALRQQLGETEYDSSSAEGRSPTPGPTTAYVLLQLSNAPGL